jgi:hypothetical protein
MRTATAFEATSAQFTVQDLEDFCNEARMHGADGDNAVTMSVIPGDRPNESSAYRLLVRT